MREQWEGLTRNPQSQATTVPVDLEEVHETDHSELSGGGVVSPSRQHDTLASLSSLTSTLSLPRLQKFSGDKVDDDEAVDQFLREFERHSVLAGWKGEVKRVQFELHLTGRALRVYENIPSEERCDYEAATKAFRRELQPVLLGSYRHTVFHNRRQQETDSVTDFAHEIQCLF